MQNRKGKNRKKNLVTKKVNKRKKNVMKNNVDPTNLNYTEPLPRFFINPCTKERVDIGLGGEIIVKGSPGAIFIKAAGSGHGPGGEYFIDELIVTHVSGEDISETIHHFLMHVVSHSTPSFFVRVRVNITFNPNGNGTVSINFDGTSCINP